MKPLAPPVPQQTPCHPQAMASRSLSAPTHGPGLTIDHPAVSGNRRPQAQLSSVPVSQTPASYAYANNPMHQSAAFAAQQAQYAGLPPPRNPSMFYNYSQPPAMQQRSQSHSCHHAASAHYLQYVITLLVVTSSSCSGDDGSVEC
ncbi:hypothetical protein C8T65DRAFT_627874 [Cerioporus squamosus]|nr:hypothetical protein C8T65DRAFT_627874 [Cerioporus squamosus]